MSHTMNLTFLIFATGLLIIAFISYFYQSNQRKWKSLNQKLIWPGICLLGSILFLRLIFIYGFEPALIEGVKEFKRNFIIELIHGIVLTLQTFSLDAEYSDVLYKGKQLFTNDLLYWLYGSLTAITSLLATLVVTSFLLGFLTSIFPQLRLITKHFKVKYVFSELNDRSISLAENIIEKAKNESKTKGFINPYPTIIFTDAYIDHTSEVNTELHQRAKAIEAICFKEDLSKITFSRKVELNYFLIDESNTSNIHSLIELVNQMIDEEGNILQKLLKYFINKKNIESKIYLFSQNPEANTIVNNLKEQKKFEDYGIVIHVVQEFTSIVYSLFDEIPLYYPLSISKLLEENESSNTKDLVVTIIGGGKIGMETFLCAYWCGQMLDCNLNINVITEDVNKFIGKINLLNPEILKSGECNNEMLRIYPNKEEQTPPYALFSFCEANVETDDLSNALVNKYSPLTLKPLLSSDYFVVALGSDEQNISTATYVDTMFQRELLKGSVKNKKPVIAYSVYNSLTNELLNTKAKQNKNTYLHAFASLKDIYSYENIIENRFEFIASLIDDIHEGNIENKNCLDEYKPNIKFKNDEYRWWSSIARALHFKYKMFSAISSYEKENPGDISSEEIDKYADQLSDSMIFDNLTWLEHRRWNAFMRTKGFIAPTKIQWDKYAPNGSRKNHKNYRLFLHPFIVESSKKINIMFDQWDNPNNENYDFLDKASFAVFEKQDTCNKYNCCRKKYLSDSKDCIGDLCQRPKDKKCKHGYCIKTDYKKYDQPYRDLPEELKKYYVRQKNKEQKCTPQIQ